ncbi:HelD family protein [Nocardiopsis alkaliphila]|uniref:HelD family protein n=1 Tax=Nocardiopsis alkaliphila TaxID=225762 RepID=UPI0003756FB9|nr:UvrD-helicase domain-containing protein [Nocardiopsis alkaliphila]
MGSTARARIIEQEQASVDRAHRCLERQRLRTERLAEVNAAASAKDGVDQHAEFTRWAEQYRIDGRQLVIQRVDLREKDEAETFYIGRKTVRDENGAVFVVKWTNPAAVRWRRERGNDQGVVTLRRRLRCRGERVVDYHDELVRDVGGAADGRPSPARVAAIVKARKEQESGMPEDPFLHEELDRSRDGLMRDIVETIHRDQLDLVCHDRPGALVVQGGPGTGKTAIGLHRVTWLLDNDHFTSEQILVVGPTKHFLDYVSEVLPSLGTRGVTSLRVDDLCPGRIGDHDTPEQDRIKSDIRMARVLRRAVHDTVNEGAWAKFLDQGRLVVRIDGDTLAADTSQIQRFFEQARDLDEPLDVRRERFTDLLADHMIDQFAYRPRGQGRALRQRITASLAGPINATWPKISESRLYRRLLDDTELLARASEGILTDSERSALHRRALGPASQESWTRADLPCLEELRILLSGQTPGRHRHIVVDEAQNLTPMQLRALDRRCPSGSFTLLGDLAQSTGTHRYPDWSALLEHLDLPNGWEQQELTLGYRIPSQVMHTAVPAAVAASDSTTFPTTLRAPRTGELTMTRVGREDLVDGVLRRVHELLARAGQRSVAVIVDDASAHRETITQALDSDPTLPADNVRVLGASAVSGLEFDHVVLVEPREITRSGPGGHGRLYVALTRCTQTLSVLYAQALPESLFDPDAPNGEEERTCTRYHADGRRCDNHARSLDGWCREPGCDGYRTEHPPLTESPFSVLETPPGADTTARLEEGVRAEDITIDACARGRFAVLHRADAWDAQAEIRAMLTVFLDQGRQMRRADGSWCLDHQGYRLVLDRAATRVLDYQTVHAERSWLQHRSGVASRISARAHAKTTTEETEEQRMSAHTPPVPAQGGPQGSTTAEHLGSFLSGIERRRGPHDQSAAGFLRHSLMADLYKAGHLPTEPEGGDVFCASEEESVLYRVLPGADTGYGRLREAAMEALEGRWSRGPDAGRVCLVLSAAPQQEWAPAALAGVLGVALIWPQEGTWRGDALIPLTEGATC